MKYIFTFLSVVLMATVSNAQTELVTGSKIKFDKLEHDFGNGPQGKPVSYEFVFTNVGTKPLVITEVKASCGCTTPSWTKEPVMPGKKGTVKAQYNMSREGQYRKSITVKTAEGETITLYIKGDVKASSSGVDGATPSLLSPSDK